MKTVEAPDHSCQIVRTEAERKAMGQFFTGDRLASLLVNLANQSDVNTVVDPMCGTGDMLVAAHRFSPDAELVGVDVDSSVTSVALQRLAHESQPCKAMIRAESAFSHTCWKTLPRREFDLVITNPPYVRYQSIAKLGTDTLGLQDMSTIRRELLASVGEFDHLSKDEQALFRRLIKGYSGLSDLAVPSWILCAMLVRPGGRMALVLPEAWLSRDYAAPIRYLLQKLFRLEFVVEDISRVWFENAQVKTTLVLAERVGPTRLDVRNPGSFVEVALTAAMMSPTSIVGKLYPSELNPDGAFAAEAWSILSTERGLARRVPFRRAPLEPYRKAILQQLPSERWFAELEPGIAWKHLEKHGSSGRPALPPQLAEILDSTAADELETLDSIGYTVGQGLRTGANVFFYWDEVEHCGDECELVSARALGMRVRVSRKLTAPVIRRQSELGGCRKVDTELVRGRVLLLDGYWPKDDVANERHSNYANGRGLLPDELDEVVRRAAVLNVGSAENPKFIPHLSAVRTNISTKQANPRAWYMLPSLARRHVPDLFVPRVNARSPRAVLNDSPPVVVDANFSTIWRTGKRGPEPEAVAALLASTWALTYMELEGAVMGGGALKVEATHLKRFPVPKLSPEDWAQLETLGHELAHSGTPEDVRVRLKIDEVVGRNLFPWDWQAAQLRLHEILLSRLSQRNQI